MSDLTPGNRLDRPVNPKVDHLLGPIDAPITLVEYGSYACPYCRAANERISKVRNELGDRLRYVFRHKPLAGNPLARPAAELVERADSPERFWDAHIKLMTRSEVLTRDDLVAVAADLDVEGDTPDEPAIARASARVDADEESARASGASITPTFFINSRRYDGPWDDSAFGDAMIGTLGHRFRAAALDFVSWGPSAGALLLLATILAIAIANTDAGPAFTAFWEQRFGLTLGGAGFAMSLRGWIDDGLLTVFFLVVGLEIKREFTVGRLSGCRAAGRRLPWRHDSASSSLPGGDPERALVARLGSGDVDRHRFRHRADRDAGGESPGRTAHLPDRGGHRRRSRRHCFGGGFLFGRAAACLSRGGDSAGRRARHAQSVARLYSHALRRRRRRLMGMRPCERAASDARGRDSRAVHPDPAAGEPEGADDASQCDRLRRGGARR